MRSVTASRAQYAYRLATEALAALEAAADPAATDDELVASLRTVEGLRRRLDRLTVGTTAALARRGTFAERGYPSATQALAELLGMERYDARCRAVAAEQVCERIGLDGRRLPARMPATAAAFADGAAGLRHIEVIASVLGSAAAARLTPQVWAGAEAELAHKAEVYTPAQLREYGRALIEGLDEDGPEPDDDEPGPEPVNELFLTRHPGGGGSIKGRFEDPAAFDAIATVIDAKAKPLTADDGRPAGQRQADALAEMAGYVLDHGDLPETGGHRPHLNVIVRLEDLENRARAGCLDFGGTMTPAALRALACDCAVVPIVMNGKGQPLDVGRLTRTIPDGLRRAVAARDRGCAHPGCDRTPSWCETHHVLHWVRDLGETKLDNLVMLCRVHHRMLHHESGWHVRIRDGLPEFIPPRWVDPEQVPRRKPLPHLVG